MRSLHFTLAVLCIAIATHSQSWNITGNAGTNPATNFIGTTDYQPLRFRVNNTYAGEINSSIGKTSFGFLAGQGNPPYYCYSVAIGTLAMTTDPGFENVAVGAFAMQYNAGGGSNSAVGFNAMSQNTTGNNNTAIGASSMYSNKTGYYNTAVGTWALRNNNGAHYNTAVGGRALLGTTNSQYNTAIGYNAGELYNLGWNNTIIGAFSGGVANNQYNIVAIGQGTVCTANSSARIGNSATWSIGGYVGWTNFSDGRYKKDIKENVIGLGFIMKLRPVTYRLDISNASKNSKENAGREWDATMKEAIAQKEKMIYTGFVAQEVAQIAKETGYEFSGVDKPENENGFYGLRYAEFVVPLVKAVQEQQAIINELQKQNAELQKRLTELERKAGFNNFKDFLSVKPNPATGKVLINITADNSSQALIKIIDSKGALVKAQQANLMQGNNQVQIDIAHLAKGIYHISAEWDYGQVKKTTQMVKQ
jgi:trimeric autotransporter adhesin